MKMRIMALALGLLVIGGASAAGAASDPPASPPATVMPAEAPRIVLPEMKYTFDAVVDGTQITHAFTVKNEGKSELAINQVKTG